MEEEGLTAALSRQSAYKAARRCKRDGRTASFKDKLIRHQASTLHNRMIRGGVGSGSHFYAQYYIVLFKRIWTAVAFF